MLPGEFASCFSASFLFWHVFRVLILLFLLLPAPFSLLSQSAPPSSWPPRLPLFTQPFLCFSPHGSPFPISYPFNHSLSSYPLLPSLSTHANQAVFFIPTTSSTSCPTCAIFSQSNHAEMQCNCANVSYPSFSCSFFLSPFLHPQAGLSECLSGERLLHYEKRLGWFINGASHVKFQIPLILWSSSIYSDTLWWMSLNGYNP